MFKPDSMQHYLDPLAGTELTADGFSTLTDLILEFAEENRIGVVLSLRWRGGYSLEGVSESVCSACRTIGEKIKSIGTINTFSLLPQS